MTATPPPVAVVTDRHDDVLHTHTALAAHHVPSGRITLHPGPGTTSETGLAHDLLAVSTVREFPTICMISVT
ncbi:hypothetical protein ACFYM2_12685 [Streptomyces sp. NPDC006711]|uniref:hypothetical protein n=1 Tax=Streptomyces sp. NPDC006711 TaxID=3364762 RepID=UPI0036C065A0